MESALGMGATVAGRVGVETVLAWVGSRASDLNNTTLAGSAEILGARHAHVNRPPEAKIRIETYDGDADAALRFLRPCPRSRGIVYDRVTVYPEVMN